MAPAVPTPSGGARPPARRVAAGLAGFLLILALSLFGPAEPGPAGAPAPETSWLPVQGGTSALATGAAGVPTVAAAAVAPESLRAATSAPGGRAAPGGALAFLSTLISPGPRSAAAVTQAEEMELGRQVYMEIAKQGAIFTDPYVVQYFMRVCQRLLKAAGPQTVPFTFTLVYSDSLNAFAVPGGYVYMHTETINSLENEGQMAAILAHEIAHITSRHFALRAEKNSVASIAGFAGMIAGALLMSQGGGSSAALGQALMIGAPGAAIQSMLANSRADESEADRKGRQYMLRAGYNARDMYGAFRIMNDKSFSLSSKIPTYMSTHPGIPARLASTFADQQDAPAAPADPVYLAMRDRVMAITADPARVRNVMNTRLKENPRDASALHALGVLAQRSKNLSQADKFYQQAIEISPSNGEYLSDAGDLAYERRKPEDAVRLYNEARRKGDSTPQTVLGLARAYEMLGRDSEASKAYDQAVSAAGTLYPRALEYAGLFFSRKGDPAKGHWLLGEYFNQTGDAKDASFHYAEVAKLPGGGRYKSRAEQHVR
ncbi:MAG: M48 family metalloprotease, partial [Deltaproteobacteria bacterium]|nr:M48 family metalloprotease [Deltaproteobacteria bacterium]